MKAIIKKCLKWFGIVLCALLALVLIFHLIPRQPRMEENIFITGRGNRPTLVAHAGGNLEFPGNTMEAIWNTYTIDPHAMFELDVNITRCGELILSHCRMLDRRTNARGQISDWTYAELLEQVSFGYFHPLSGNTPRPLDMPLRPFQNYAGQEVTPLDVRYPPGVEARHPYRFLPTRLEDVVTTFPNNTISVEIKQYGDLGRTAIDSVIEMMVRLDAQYNTFGRMVLASFRTENYEYFLEMQEAHPQIMFSPNSSALLPVYVTHWFGLDFVFRHPFTIIQIPTHESGLPLHRRHFINAMQRHNVAVHYWTINDEDMMRTLIARGANGITTGRPTLFKQIADEIFGPGYSPDLLAG